MHILLYPKVGRALAHEAVDTNKAQVVYVYVCVYGVTLCNMQICLTIYCVPVYTVVYLTLYGPT